MFLDALDRRIRKSFSDAALQYDVLSSLHKEIGRELSRKVIDNENVDHILDIGMGTGWLTNRLSFFLPDSLIVGLDFAPNMVNTAKKKWEDIKVIQANAGLLPFKKNSFDMIVSNLAYQWIQDLDFTFQENYQVLNDNGKIYLTLFGFNTFKELFDSFEQTKSSTDTTFRRLYSMENITASIEKAGFNLVKSDYEIIKVHFPDMVGLMKWIKDIGANVLNNEMTIGKQWIERASRYYEEHYRDKFSIYATFEVIWIEGVKKI
ncbi:MAG: methyltransferase domain-containing protein [Candidatus Omnitrophica bacterium]|nr:methyltransferase domain-containing protein [Candidatus Omnitrophota bacterium]